MRTARISIAALAVLLTVVSVSEATPFKVATFLDPAADASTPLFTISHNQQTGPTSISGGWTSTGLTLELLGTPYNDVTFDMPAVSITALMLDPGTLTFYDDQQAQLMQISWNKAGISDFGFGARDSSWTGTDVTITYQGQVQPLDSESFSFSFANFYDVDPNTTTVTSAFTSSAVPEPAAFLALAAGSVALLLTRRHGSRS